MSESFPDNLYSNEKVFMWCSVKQSFVFMLYCIKIVVCDNFIVDMDIIYKLAILLLFNVSSSFVVPIEQLPE